ncbi:MAG: Thiol-disulfide oxidoreductase ResA [Planctomycetota bacterium]
MPCSVGCLGWLSLPSVATTGMVWGSIAVAVALAGGGARAARGADVDGGATLSLPGGTLPGRLVAAFPPAEGASPTIRWQSPAFAGPFEFPLDRVGGISFDRQPGVLAASLGERWQLELADGDLVVGRLVSIDESTVVMSIGPAEAPVRITVARESVRRISTGGAPSTYVWNGGLDHCQTSAASHWRKRAGGLASTTSGAMLRIDGGEGDRIRYDLSLGWDEPPRVRLGCGEFRSKSNVGGDVGPGDAAYRIELTAEGLIVVRDEARPDGTGVADLAPCGDLSENGLTLSVFIDRQAGRIVVVRPGESVPLCDLAVEPLPVAPVRAFPEQTGQVEGQGEGLQVDVLSGAVVLESLRISPWNGSETLPDEDQPAAVELNDGRVITGNVTGLSDDGRALVVVPGEAAGFSPQNVLLETVAAIRFPAAAAPPAGEESASPRRVRVSDRYGSSLTGELVGVAEGNITIKHAAIAAPVSLPIGFLEGIGTVTSVPEDSPPPGRVGRLELADTTHDGCLVPVSAEGAAGGPTAVGWLPRGSLKASMFAPAADGSAPQATIRYAESRPDDGGDDSNGWIGATLVEVDGEATIAEVVPGGPLHRLGVVAPLRVRAVAPRGDGVFVATKGLPIEDVMFLVQGRAGTEVQLQITEGTFWTRRNLNLERGLHPIWGRDGQRLREVFKAQERLLARAKRKEAGDTEQKSFQSVVVLETGEAVDGDVESIDERGVRLLREGAEPVTIPASAVKAVELVPKTGVLISPEKFRSLTTLPRSQRLLPPTHLVRSMQGDYLRGRLESMDGENLRIAVDADPRGKPLSIPRQDVSRVIWLHPESLDPTWQPEALRSSPGLPVEAVTLSVGRLRMAATGIEGNVLVGSHAIFGPSRIDLNSIDRLLIGGVLEETPKRLPYAQWQLQPAAEPRNLPKKRLAKP